MTTTYLFLILVTTVVIAGDTKSLYTKEDLVIEADYKTFNSTVYGKEKTFLVEFYSSWCGHCISYAPKFKQFARDVHAWSSVFEPVVVNCADDDNVDLCREHNIGGYPTLKIFNLKAENAIDGSTYKGNYKSNVDMLALDMGQMVLDNYRQHSPSAWPIFSDVIAKDKLLHEVANAEGAKLFVVCPAKKSALAAAVTLDLDAQSKQVKVIIIADDHALIKNEGILTNKTDLAIFDTRDLSRPLLHAQDTKEYDMHTVRHQAVNRVHELLGGTSSAASGSQITVTEDAFRKINQHVVHYTDLLSAVSYSLHHEVAIRSVIDGDTLKSLQQFLHLLSLHLPVRPPVKRLLARLHQYSERGDDNTPVTSIDGAKWKEKFEVLNEQLGRPMPVDIKWVSCQGSAPQYRGYSCGLWTMFHVLVADVYNQRDASSQFGDALVATAISEYIKHFFGCADCAMHFERAAGSKISEQVKKRGDAVIWLWMAHNKANARLQIQTDSSDPQYPKRQFPPVDLCPACRISTNTDADATTNSDVLFNSIEWDRQAVLEFLVKYYSAIVLDNREALGFELSEPDGSKSHDALSLSNIYNELHRDIDNEERIIARRSSVGLDFSASSKMLSWSVFDWTLCLSVWVVCMVGVAMLCLYLNYRRNRHRLWKRLYTYTDYKV